MWHRDHYLRIVESLLALARHVVPGLRAFDSVSVIIRGSIVQLVTPDGMRTRFRSGQPAGFLEG